MTDAISIPEDQTPSRHKPHAEHLGIQILQRQLVETLGEYVSARQDLDAETVRIVRFPVQEQAIPHLAAKTKCNIPQARAVRLVMELALDKEPSGDASRLTPDDRSTIRDFVREYFKLALGVEKSGSPVRALEEELKESLNKDDADFSGRVLKALTEVMDTAVVSYRESLQSGKGATASR